MCRRKTLSRGVESSSGILAVDLLDAALECGDPPARNAKYLEKGVLERLSIGVLGLCMLPIARKGQRAAANLLKGDWHFLACRGNGAVPAAVTRGDTDTS